METGSKHHKIASHPAAFPAAFPAASMQYLTAVKENIFDPFCGSGTTLMAAERLDRNGYGLEIEPKYCDVSVTRWCNFTKQTKIKLNGQEIEWSNEALQREA